MEGQTLLSKDRKQTLKGTVCPRSTRTRTKVSLHLDFLSWPLSEQAQISLGSQENHQRLNQRTRQSSLQVLRLGCNLSGPWLRVLRFRRCQDTLVLQFRCPAGSSPWALQRQEMTFPSTEDVKKGLFYSKDSFFPSQTD